NSSAALAIQITSVQAPAPTNLSAAPGNNTIGLTWTTSSGAASYDVKRSLANGGPYTVIGNSGVANYVDLTAVDGTTYYYVVSAIAGGSETANSNQASAIPAATPSTTTVASSLGTTGTYGATVTFTATVTAGASGAVTFKDGGTVLDSVTLAAGQATYTTSAFQLGGHSITATYAGDATYAASTSTTLDFTVTAKPLAITGVTAADKVYDGTTGAVLSGGAVTGVLNGETVTVVAGTGTFADPNVGTNKTVTATGYTFSGANAAHYTPVQPTGLTATITARTIQATGARVYDGTTAMAAANLTIGNKVDGDTLALTGSAMLAGKDAGAQGFVTNYATPARVQSATGSTGAAAAGSFGVPLTSTPVAGNTLIAVISTRGTSANRVSSITQTGVSWTYVTQATNSGGTTTEIWVASNVPAGAATTVTITQASLRSAAVVIEYSGILAASPLDQISSATGTNTSAGTGTTATTTQTNELWIGGIGIADGRRTLNAPYGNSFTVVASSKSSTSSSDAMIYALEKI
ncbi:MAG: YDG domain-containing protein, partial [Verrucomicrobiota bacterium]